MVYSLEIEQDDEIKDGNSLSLTAVEGNKEGNAESIVSDPGSFLTRHFGKTMLTLPFLFTFIVLQAIFQASYDFISSPFALVGQFLASNRETDNILEAVPKDQKTQKHDLDIVHKNQIQQREKIKKLEERINRLEKRKAARIQNENVPVSRINCATGETRS